MPSLQWRVRCRKLDMQGGVLGKHAPANANTLITIRAAIINSLPFADCLDDARMSSLGSPCQPFVCWCPGRSRPTCRLSNRPNLSPVAKLPRGIAPHHSSLPAACGPPGHSASRFNEGYRNNRHGSSRRSQHHTSSHSRRCNSRYISRPAEWCARPTQAMKGTLVSDGRIRQPTGAT